MRQYLAASLEDLAYFSAPMYLEEGAMAEQFFQVLACRTQGVFIKTLAAVDDEPVDGLFNISVQWLEAWRAQEGCPGADPERRQEVFVLQEPIMVDALDVFARADRRDSWLRWKPEASDLVGRISLAAPEVLRPTASLASDQHSGPILVRRLASEWLGNLLGDACSQGRRREALRRQGIVIKAALPPMLARPDGLAS